MPGRNIVGAPMTGRRARLEEGPWTISAAETPHDPSSYSLYIKTCCSAAELSLSVQDTSVFDTPTHNITLTRTAQEVVELQAKLRDSFPGMKLPTPPIDASSIPAPPKRKSAFLNTLSRLASPASNKIANSRQVSGKQQQPPSSLSSSTASSALSSNAQTPIATPTNEINDPFTEIGENGEDISALAASNNKVITGLAAYLTTLANDSTLRQSRAWKRFVRVRTDDLQSVRVERAIKRVRSDLAAHVSPGSSTEINRSISQVVADSESAASSVDGEISDVTDDIKEDAEGEQDAEEGTAEGPEDRAPTPMSPKPAATAVEEPKSENGDVDEENFPRTPIQEATRSQRSQSAGPTTRSSRLYSSTPSTASQTTGDDSSISTTERRSRKKRSKSKAPDSEKKSQRKVVVDDFEMMRVLGKGCAGKVLLVRHKPSQDVYALKAITKRHVLAHQELQHTLTEQAVLKRMAAENTDPFVVKLWWSFHDKENLFLVMDFHPGGDLATQLARWGRLGRDRARFYAAEIVEGVEGLHAAGVIYRDLKPENILIGADGHIVLTDFGLSKEFPRRTSAITAPPTPSGSRGGEFLDGGSPVPASPPWMKPEHAEKWTAGSNDTTSTFCGTAEYLAPEVIQGLPYSYEVDWWSFGTMLYEMLTGITPFWAENHSDMYYRVLQDELQFPEDRTMDQDTKSLIRGLLQRNPALRMKEPRIKKHPYFSMIDWSHVYYKRYIPPYIPPIDPSNASDTQNFDDTFLGMEPVINDENEEGAETDQDRTDGEDSVTTPSQSRSPSVHPVEDDSVDVFDGYSFKGRHSVILDDEEEDGGDEEEEEEEEEESVGGPSLDDLLPDELATGPSKAEVEEVSVPEEAGEPKTPEARPAALPAEEAPATAVPKPETATPRTSQDRPAPTVPSAEAAAAAAATRTAEDANIKTAPKVRPTKLQRNRREKSGIPALDKNLPDRTDDEGATEREEDEDDWDFVEAGGLLVEERNGAKGTSLFARGVVDRYKLAVFRKSTPRRSTPRSFSGVSVESDLNGSEAGSPSPSDKHRRGRTPGLTFRKHPKQFLRQKSPPPSSRSAKSLASTSATLSAASTVSSAGLLTPSASQTAMSPSLKSKESAISMGTTPSDSSDQSMNGDALGGDTVKGNPVHPANGDEEKQQKNKVLKKYKEGAEKVLSIFQSPR
ncbi:kinase-like protein [Lentinus tigrinus ALCF2SS1-7]|uniref:kinase-like protein n=1 Tax=Lentinus tigrinus ALCF2SS1-7 TaxID=1328758 RepID=UPI001165DDF4|nr:kinase-like protein [Lentinus tigrinus ALCF2SS1-7]